jgi:hypothetical protein
VSKASKEEHGHYRLLRAFVDEATLRRVDHDLDTCGYRTHEFGDSVLIERTAPIVRVRPGARDAFRTPDAAPESDWLPPLGVRCRASGVGRLNP